MYTQTPRTGSATVITQITWWLSYHMIMSRWRIRVKFLIIDWCHNLLNEEQAGFISQYDTTDHIFSWKMLIDYYLSCYKKNFTVHLLTIGRPLILLIDFIYGTIFCVRPSKKTIFYPKYRFVLFKNGISRDNYVIVNV
jgi:hypothetical protein